MRTLLPHAPESDKPARRRPRRDPLAAQRARALAALLAEPGIAAALVSLDAPGSGRSAAEQHLAESPITRARLATLGLSLEDER